MSEDFKELFQLASRALHCQAELGCREIFLEQTGMEQSMTEGHKRSEGAEFQQVLFEDKPQFASLEEHYRAICNCTKCRLHEERTNFVYGVGNEHADIMFIGEAPGREEDLKGEPFVGRAGQLLDKILNAIGFSRQDVYITNIVKSRPPQNRDPQPDEIAACMPYLREQIRLIRPQLICALGRVAAQALLHTTAPLGKMRGEWHKYEGIPVLVTYHPAALLRFPQYKRGTWEDVQRLKTEYERINNNE
jgi:uracil-DNA glycosylase family 4